MIACRAMRPLVLVTRSLQCVACDRPVTAECRLLPDHTASWLCPYTGCARENLVVGVGHVVSVVVEPEPRAGDDPNLLTNNAREQDIARHLARLGVRALSVVVGRGAGTVIAHVKVGDVIERFTSHARSDVAAAYDIARLAQPKRRRSAE